MTSLEIRSLHAGYGASPVTRALLRAHEDRTSGAKIIDALLYLEEWRGGAPLRECRYSLGNTVLEIAGSAEQQARWADKTIAIALTEPGGGSDPAAARTTATWDTASGEWVIEGEKNFITYAQRSAATPRWCWRVWFTPSAAASPPSWSRRERRDLASGANTASWAYASKTRRASYSPAVACRRFITSTAT